MSLMTLKIMRNDVGATCHDFGSRKLPGKAGKINPTKFRAPHPHSLPAPAPLPFQPFQLSPGIIRAWHLDVLPRLEQILEGILGSSPEPATINLVAIGANPVVARPSVMITCLSVSKVGVLIPPSISCDGLVLDVFVQKDRLRYSKADTKASDSKLSFATGTEENDEENPMEDEWDGSGMRALNPFYQNRPVSGASIGVYRTEHLPPVSFGGIVMLDGEPFGMTAHHALDEPSDDESEAERSTSPETLEIVPEWNPDFGDEQSASLNDILDAKELENEESTGEEADNAESDDEFLSDDPDEPLDIRGDIAGVEQGDGENIIITQPAIDDVDEDFFPYPEDMDDDHLGSHTLGFVYATSGIRRYRDSDGIVHEVDWALFKIQDDRLQPFNIIEGGLRYSPIVKNQPALQLINRPVKTDDEFPSRVAQHLHLGGSMVHSVTRTSGLKPGWIAPAMSSVRIYRRRNFSRSWHILGQFGIGGDSGAWIISNEDSRICGHVLAWCERNRLAYMCPMEVLLADMKNTLRPKEISMPGSSQEAATSSNMTYSDMIQFPRFGHAHIDQRVQTFPIHLWQPTVPDQASSSIRETRRHRYSSSDGPLVNFSLPHRDHSLQGNQTTEHTSPYTMCQHCKSIDFSIFNRKVKPWSRSKVIMQLHDVQYKIPQKQLSSCAMCEVLGDLWKLLPERIKTQSSHQISLHTLPSLDALCQMIVLDTQPINRLVLGLSMNDYNLSNTAGYLVPTSNYGMGEPCVHGRCIQPNSIDYSLLKNWIESCSRIHKDRCRPPWLSISMQHRLRFIDCRERRVVEFLNLPPYAVLSYVWGVSHAKSPSSSVDYSKGLKELPLVIEDAISVTLRLGFRFLWVDKYCIHQDDENDVSSHLKIMDKIYGQADFTIIAAAGSDASYGLPGVSSTERTTQPSAIIEQNNRTIQIVSTMCDPQLLISSSTWKTRGWTYQEAVFSRCRLFFTSQQVYFECNSLCCSETVDIAYEELSSEGTIYMREGLYGGGFSGDGRISSHIQTFSTLNLTQQSDALNAILGILNKFERMGIHHASGIPVEFSEAKYTPALLAASFARGLSWVPDGPMKRRPSFPSWSWAGWIGAIGPWPEFGGLTKSEIPRLDISLAAGESDGVALEEWRNEMNQDHDDHRHAYPMQELISHLHIEADVIEDFSFDIFTDESAPEFAGTPQQPGKASQGLSVYIRIGGTTKSLYSRVITLEDVNLPDSELSNKLRSDSAKHRMDAIILSYLGQTWENPQPFLLIVERQIDSNAVVRIGHANLSVAYQKTWRGRSVPCKFHRCRFNIKTVKTNRKKFILI